MLLSFSAAQPSQKSRIFATSGPGNDRSAEELKIFKPYIIINETLQTWVFGVESRVFFGCFGSSDDAILALLSRSPRRRRTCD